MANKSTIAIELIVNDNGSVTIKKFGSEAQQSFDQVRSATDSASASLQSQIGVVKQLAVAYGLWKIADYVKDATLLAARYETLGVVMKVVGNNAGYTGAQMEGFAQGLEKSGISMTEARQSITRMVQAQLDLNQSSKLARVAQDAAVIGNINSSESFARLVDGIQSGETVTLRNIGINVNFENSYQKVAAATGRAVTSFTEAEKANIRMSAAMDAGEKISGTYEAAMDTAGKQALSLTRHLENLQVLFGKAFTPALAEIIETITGAVTDLNGELSGDGKQKVEDWGNNFRLIIINIEAGIMRLGMFIDKVGGTLTSIGMIATGWGSALNIKSVKSIFESLAQANIDLENRYNSTGKSLEKLAEKYIKLEASMKKQKQAAQDTLGTEEAAETTVVSVEKIAKAYGDLISITSKYGEARLKLSEADFAKNLKTEQATIAQLKAGLEAYMTTLQAVYTTRIEGEKKIAEAMGAAGGKPGEALKAQLEALKQEEKYYTDRLAGQQKYYDTLAALHSKATDAMKKKTEELKVIEDAMARQRVEYAALALSLQEKLLVAQGKAVTDQSLYAIKLEALEKARAAASTLSGDEQVKALEKVQKEYGEMTGAVTEQNKVFDLQSWKWVETNTVVITQEEAIKKSMEAVASVQRDIQMAQDAARASKEKEIAANQLWITDLSMAMASAKAQMDEYKSKIDALSLAIANMEREIAISVIDKATDPIRAIKAELDKLQDKVINVTVNQPAATSGDPGNGVYYTSGDPGPLYNTYNTNTNPFNEPSYNEPSYGSSGGYPNDHSGGYGGGTYQIPDPGQSSMYDDYGNLRGYGGGAGGSSMYADNGDLIGYGKGAAFNRGNVIPFARGGVFDRPTLFPMAKGMGLMGEAGEEAVMPLARGRDGKLGVRASGGGQVIHFSPSIVISGVNKSPEQLAREIVRPLRDEMRRLEAVN